MRLLTRTPIVALIGVGFLAAILLAPISLIGFTACALVVLGAEALVFNARRLWMPTVVQRSLGNGTRLLVLELLTLFALVVRFPDSSSPIVGAGLASIVLRAVKVRMTELVHARSEPHIAWRNLEVRQPRRRLVKNLLTSNHTREKMWEILVVLLAILPAVGLGVPWPVEIALIAIVGLRVSTLPYLGTTLVHLTSEDVLARTRQAVRTALEQYDPQVVMFLGGYYELFNTVNVWTPTLDAIRQRSIIVVRDRWHLDNIRTEHLPVLYLPTANDVEEFLPQSVRVALYPLNHDRNTDILDRPTITDVFVGHGDSDKGSSANPIAKMYDEIWVAGPAAVDRYRRAESGVDLTRIRQVGRPQLAEMRRAAHGDSAGRTRFTVLYAPTWEGPFPEWSYSSLPFAAALMERLVAIPDVRVIYKRHHATGTRDRRYRAHEREILDVLKRAGKPHRAVMKLDGLYQSFNDADMMISDVSSVITDFLYSRKPYIVTNPGAIDTEEFHAEFPSSAGAPLLAPDLGGLEEMIADARGADMMRLRRLAAASWLLGDSEEHPLKRFEDAIDDVLHRPTGDERRLAAAQPVERGR